MVEKMELCLYGIEDKTRKVVRIAVYVDGKSVRLKGPHKSHLVHAMHAGSEDGWKREARLVFGVTISLSLLPHQENSPEGRERIAELEASA